MKAVVFERHGEPAQVLEVRDLPLAEPGPNQVRVRMLASPVNPSDLLYVRGNYGPAVRLPATPGFEGVGAIDAVGPGLLKLVRGLRPGRRVAVLKAPTGKKTFLTPFYNWFNRVFGRGTDAYVSFSGILIRKTARSLLFIGILVGMIVVLGRHIPAGFIPEEDQGYLLAQVNLPDASSLERTDRVMKKAEAIIKANEAVEGYNTVTGFSLWRIAPAYA